MNYGVELARDAARYLRRLDRVEQQRMVRRIDQLADDPFGPHTKPLTNLPGRRAARVGGYRIVFTVDQDAKVVRVSDIAPRGQVYRDL